MTLSFVEKPLRFVDLEERPIGGWPRPRRFNFLNEIGAIPIADTELLQTSLYLPLVIHARAGACEVVAIVHSDFLAQSPVRADGRWTLSYMPIALRCLPLRRRNQIPGKKPAFEIASDFDAGEDAAILPFFVGEGRMQDEFAAALSHLERLETGKTMLAKAAASLLAADLLVKLVSTSAEKKLSLEDGLLVVDLRRLRELSHARTAALAADSMLALHLATACCLSNRLWAPHLAIEASDDNDNQRLAPSAASFDDRAHGSFPIELRVDDSSLFSIDTFVRNDGQHAETG